MALRRNIVIVGGGLAGLTSAIHLARAGVQVTLIEKHSFPKHKVCGEYISNEVLPYLQWLDADPAVLMPAQLSRVLVSAVSGKTISARLPLGGFGVSRYTLDHFLMQCAVRAGCSIVEDTVTDVQYAEDGFTVYTATHGMLQAALVLGAYGKRSVLDQRLSRDFLQQKSPWLAVKGHYTGSFPDGLVALHNFHGGYCGVSKIEADQVNICYLVSYDTFKQYKNTEVHREQVLYRNSHLKAVFEACSPLFEQPLTISQVSFAAKTKVEAHMLMTGDTAGLIHPLCGNGMAMAIHSAKIAAELAIQFLETPGYSQRQLEHDYSRTWNRLFNSRMKAGRMLTDLFLKDRLSTALIQGLASFPALLPFIIRQTHGKLIKI